VQDLFLAPVGKVAEREPPLAGDAAVDVVERALVAAVDERVVDRCAELVFRRAVHGPVGCELLSRAEDLLDDDEKGSGVASPSLTPAQRFLQPPEIVAGPEEAVHVIDAQLR
jgi:hypothetical protein